MNGNEDQFQIKQQQKLKLEEANPTTSYSKDPSATNQYAACLVSVDV